MKRNLIVLGLAALAFTSCKQFKKGEGDLHYIIHEDKDGPKIQKGDFIVFKATQKTEEDSVMFNTEDSGRPGMTGQQDPVFKGDYATAFAMLSEGDSATFKISLDSLNTKMGMPKVANTKGKYVILNVKIDKVIAKGKQTEPQFQAKVEQYFKAEAEKAKNREGSLIEAYVKDKDLKPTTTASGLKYVITKEGSGAKPNVGDTVELNYTGRFVTGANKMFDTSFKEVAEKEGKADPMRPYKPIKVPAGAGSTIPGFDEALLLLNKGAKATIIVPSKLGYGPQGNQMFGPYTPLTFELEIVNITKGSGLVAPPMTPMAPPAAAPQAK